MILTIKDEKETIAGTGDFIIIKTEHEVLVRQIIKYSGKYIAINVHDGNAEVISNNIEGLIKNYETYYSFVEIVKNADAELIIGGE